MYCVRVRDSRAGAAPARVVEHIAAARKHVDADKQILMSFADRVEAARNRLDGAFAALKRAG